ncbi:MAG: NYN domain-containing protein [Proteobacteria bacterium]|nr:NYN domain-containing protein [Pseudomonadota bacterium]
MASQTEITNMAVFCDFENVALGVRDANYAKFDIDKVLERLLLKGNIVVRKAYCDWDRYKQFKRSMHEASFELIEIPHVRQSGKNSADIRMVVDALDLCYTKAHLDTFVLLTGDSDFSPLVAKLRENAKTVIGVGVKQSTSDLLINICDEFIYYDDLVREQLPGRGGVPRGRTGTSRRSGSARPDGNGHAVQPMVGPPLPLHESLRGPARGAPRERNVDAGSREAPGESATESVVGAQVPAAEPTVRPVAEATLVPAEGAGIDDGTLPAAEGEAGAGPAPRGRARAKSTRTRAGSRRGSAAPAVDENATAAEAAEAEPALVVTVSGAGASESTVVPADEAVVAEAPAPTAKGRARRPRAGSKAALAAAAKLAEAEAEAAAEAAAQPSAVTGSELAEAGTNPAAIHPADPVSDGSDKAQQAIDLVLATVEALVAERGEEERIWGSMVKQTLKRRNPGFNESYYGFRSFSELLEEAQARRLLELTRDEKSGGFILRLTHHDD